MALNVLIADDDDGMLLVLKKAVQKMDGFNVVAEASDGEEALKLFSSLRPGIVFLDVEMPGLSGLECAKRIMDINPRTYIIFATAHEEFMSEAFEVYAFDYLVKPFRLERIKQSLERIRDIESAEDEHLPYHAPSKIHSQNKIMIKNRDGASLVDTSDILLIQREESITAIYTSDTRYTTSDTLAEIAEKLDENTFYRCHKSYIVNLSAVHKIYPYGRWTYIVKLKGTDKDALMTRDKYDELEKLYK